MHYLQGPAPEQAHAVAAQVEFERNTCKQFVKVQFQALCSRPFQHGFDTVNLHRPTMPPPPPSLPPPPVPPVTGVSSESAAAGRWSDRVLAGFTGGGGELKVSPSKTPSIAVAESAQAWPPTRGLHSDHFSAQRKRFVWDRVCM
jgi:hypothetical protein